MIGEAIGSAAQAANSGVADPAKEKIKELQDWLPHRPEIEDETPKFVKGIDFSTPDGEDPTVPATGTEATDPDDPSSNTDLGLQIEFIHVGYVNRDMSSLFVGTEATDDTKVLEADQQLGGRALNFRAALQREAVFLGGLAKSISDVMTEKQQAESGIGELVQMTADLLGGQGGTSTEPSPADMMQFLDKVAAAYNQINVEDITYTNLHDVGIQLHTVRATLLKYLHDLLPKPKDPNADPNAEPPASTPSPTGMLSKLPFLGDGLPIPGPIGDVIGYMRMVTGKIYDVQNMTVYALVIAMQPAIENACRDITNDYIRDGRSPVYSVWTLPDDPNASSGKIPSVTNPGEVLDFLSKPYPSPPGGKYLDSAFQAATDTDDIFGGSEHLGELAVAAFYAAISDDPPEFLKGFIADFLAYIFAVDLEFLRGIYRQLCSMPTNELLDPDEIVAAGSVHLVEHFIDLAMNKLGLDEVIKGLTLPIPSNPLDGMQMPQMPSTPFGSPSTPSMPNVPWPSGTLAADPIVQELKKTIADKIGPFIEPIVGYACSGLAARLNATRAWAKGGAFTMEAHLAALPSELVFLFRNTFGPLWSFITDIVYGIVGGVLKDALGPAADAMGFMNDATTAADSYISQAQNWATEAQTYATDVESKAQGVMSSLSGVGLGQGGPMGLPSGVTGTDGVQSAVGALTGAAGSNPFSPLTDPFAPSAGELFPEDRVVTGKGTNIEQTEYDTVSPNHKYDEAEEAGSDPYKVDDDKDASSTDPNAAAGTSADPSAAGGTSSAAPTTGGTP